jgi:hypothetical protein
MPVSYEIRGTILGIRVCYHLLAATPKDAYMAATKLWPSLKISSIVLAPESE